MEIMPDLKSEPIVLMEPPISSQSPQNFFLKGAKQIDDQNNGCRR
jgi:hypothetical protein